MVGIRERVKMHKVPEDRCVGLGSIDAKEEKTKEKLCFPVSRLIKQEDPIEPHGNWESQLLKVLNESLHLA